MSDETFRWLAGGTGTVAVTVVTGILRYLLARNAELQRRLDEYELPAREATKELLRRGWRERERERDRTEPPSDSSWPSLYRGDAGPRRSNPRRKP